MKITFALLTALAITGSAAAQSYPERPIRLIVPYQAGGTLDTLARKTAHAVEPNIKQAIIIDNRPGANGMIGVEAVAKAPADGYTMLFNSSGMLINQVVRSTIRYDTLRDLVPVTEGMSQDAYLLLVGAQSSINDLNALLAEARKKPGGLSYASPGVGNGQHLFFETLNSKAGTQMTHVPYKGIPDMVQALIRGDVDTMVLNPLLAVPHMDTGRVRAIAYINSDATRSKDMPELPAIAEAIPGLSWKGSRFGFFFPTNTPTPIVKKMQDEITKALQTPDLQEYLKTGGFTPVGSTSEAFTEAISEDLKRFAEIAQQANIRVD